ncbi:MAG: gdhB1 [Fibrobacteres bacterium]|nr:gdhB1 [Fibrobacterota bacterium]
MISLSTPARSDLSQGARLPSGRGRRLPLLALAALHLASMRPAQAQACVLNDADFKRTILVDQPQEPMKMAALPDGRLLWTEKRGTVKLLLADGKTVSTAGTLTVQATEDQGLHGIAVDPAFATNNWIYLAYDPKTDPHPKGPGRWVSRFTLNGNVLDMASEKKLLHVEIQRTMMGGCCHQGGALAMDPQGNLYWSIGEQSDYTVPSSLTNEAVEHQNSLRSAGNTNDLRGKIIRIHPEADGSYTVPEGNLFPKTLEKTRPEIYAMGVRNPFTIAVDPKTGWLWEGEVGTDVTLPSAEKGAVGYDEINLITKAAHLGYPFLNGPNEAFRNYDYVANKPLELFDPDHLVNNSRFNTGLVDLAPAGKPLPALVYWTVRKQYSTAFPLGDGKTAGMVGPTYRFDPALSNSTKLPAWLDGKVVFWDHERETIRLLTLTADRKVARIDSFMTNVKWSGIVDIQQGPGGSLFVAEYGHGYYTPNPTAKISRIDYIGAPCGSVSVAGARNGGRAPGYSRVAYADPVEGLALEIPRGSEIAVVFDLAGRELWRSRPGASGPRARSAGTALTVQAPASALSGKGLVLVGFR